MVTMVVLVRTVAEARSQSQCSEERRPSGPLFTLGSAPSNVSLQSVLMVVKLNFSDCSQAPGGWELSA